MQSVAAILWFLPSVVFGVGTVITILAMRRAPDGYENADGFHYLRPTDTSFSLARAESADVVHSGDIGLA